VVGSPWPDDMHMRRNGRQGLVMENTHSRTRSLARAITRARSGTVLSTMVVALGIAACGSTSTPATSAQATKIPAGTFTVQINFTGATSVQGSFTTPTVGATCKQYATSSLAWTIGLGPDLGNPITVGGQTVNFEISVPQSTFHGTGNYSGNVVSGLTVGLETFAGIDSTMLLNGDGSGNATFSKYIGTTSSATESGTITWTCAQ
jgi:hypothetical protein